MAFVYGDRVKETSLSSGTGVMALGGAAVGFQTFAVGVGVGNECFYGIVNTTDDTWEMGRGTIGPGTLTRDVVISSTNSNLLVNFVAGQKIVYTTVPKTFYNAALDAAAHELIDHTAAPLNLMDAAAHDLIDHSVGPFNLLPTANLPTEHALIDHKLAPFNLLDTAAHNLINHTAGPLNLLDNAAHASTNHYTVITNAIPQVTGPEKTAGTSTLLKSYSPLDIADMAGIHGGGGGGGGKLAQYTFNRDASTSSTAITTTPPALPIDGTAFDNARGAPGITHTHTPLSASNTLVIRAYVVYDHNVGGTFRLGLFKDAEPNARAVSFQHMSAATAPCDHVVTYQMVAGTVSPILFSTRVVTQFGGTLLINQRNGGSTQGGAMVSHLDVFEIEP